MISVERLLYKLDQKLDKVASNQHQHIPDENKIYALNEAQIRLIKQKVSVNNIFQLGFDSFRLRYQDLQNLVVPYESVIPTKTSEKYFSYKVDTDKLKNKFFLPVDILAISKKGNCSDRILNINRIVKHSDLSVLMNNSHFRPSFKWQETVAVISNDDIIIYTNDPDGPFELTSVEISYMRYPVEMDIEGYIKLETGIPSETVNCELSEHLEDELLVLTVKELGIEIEDYNKVQQQQNFQQ